MRSEELAVAIGGYLFCFVMALIGLVIWRGRGLTAATRKRLRILAIADWIAAAAFATYLSSLILR